MMIICRDQIKKATYTKYYTEREIANIRNWQKFQLAAATLSGQRQLLEMQKK